MHMVWNRELKKFAFSLLTVMAASLLIVNVCTLVYADYVRAEYRGLLAAVFGNLRETYPDVAEPVADPERVVYKLNFLLPGDIAVGSMLPVSDEAHARFSATEREYRYFIEPRKNPFTRGAAWQYYVPLDMERMNEAAASLLRYRDFTSFAKLNSNNKTNICRILRAAWTEDERGVLCFTIRADRFLRNMVRSLTGTLVDVGRGRYTPADFCAIVESRDLSRSSGGAPAQGLFLSDVRYPAELFGRTVFY